MPSEDEQVDALATRNRLLAASMFAGLTEEQWRTPSLCAGWTVREVCAHLIPPEGGFTLLALVWDVIRFRGDLARMVDSTAREGARRPTAELVGSLRERAGERLKAPVGSKHRHRLVARRWEDGARFGRGPRLGHHGP